MSVFKHELGVQPSTTPRRFQPWLYAVLNKWVFSLDLNTQHDSWRLKEAESSKKSDYILSTLPCRAGSK